ncbi:hypothetical protein OAJ75_03440 [Candidatus Pelagibacter sp.]|nr:hypothetical protein [Candidatus Pelagibacter sp.]
MIFRNKLNKIRKFSKLLFITILLFNTIFIFKLYANSFKINEIEVSEDFNLTFNKQKVFDKAFQAAFIELTSAVISSKDIKKIEKTTLSTIKSLVDSFNIIDEKFYDDKYIARINVNFNKKSFFAFLVSKNIFPSIPKKINVLIIPILTNSQNNQFVLFSENPIYLNWNNYNKKYHLLNYILPTEDIDDAENLRKNIELIEEYKFQELIKKYELKNYIILIMNQDNNKINLMSKLQLNGTYKILNQNYKDIKIDNETSIKKIVLDIKNSYEDEWKKLNLINTSIKLPLTLSVPTKEIDKIKLLDKVLGSLDLVSNYQIVSFTSKSLIYKIIYNGSPDKFFNEIRDMGIIFNKKNMIWEIK